MPIRAIALASLLAAFACRSNITALRGDPLSDSAPDVPAIVPDGTEFLLQSGQDVLSGVIPFTFTNHSDQPASIPNCNGTYSLVLEKESNDSWVKALSGDMMMGCLSSPIVIAPGGVMVDTLRIIAGHQGSITYPQFIDKPAGNIYRLSIARVYWDYDEDEGRGLLLPEGLRTSNNFTIRVK